MRGNFNGAGMRGRLTKPGLPPPGAGQPRKEYKSGPVGSVEAAVLNGFGKMAHGDRRVTT